MVSFVAPQKTSRIEYLDSQRGGVCVCVCVNTVSEWVLLLLLLVGGRGGAKRGRRKEGGDVDVLTEREGGNGCWWLGGCL